MAFRHDWSFTPFVVVVGGKYFLPVSGANFLEWSEREFFVCRSI